MNEMNKLIKKDLFILLNETQRSESVKWSTLKWKRTLNTEMNVIGLTTNIAERSWSYHKKNKLWQFNSNLVKNTFMR